ncbi:MAG: DUF3530 family protein [Acidiferrobacterales bacterium]
MKLVKKIVCGFVLCLSFFVFSIQASDIAKEKRWADQVVDEIMTGDAIWLQADGRKFLGIYAESTNDQVLGAAIILHGVGVHPNWADVIHPLRTRLPESGWHTLSLQLPILPNKAEFKEYAPLFVEIAPRIDAAVAYLRKKRVETIVLIGHSLGATMAGYYVANNKGANVRALVAIGATGNTFKDPKRDYIQSLKNIMIPILDLSGTEDLPDVTRTKELKARTAKTAGNKRYQQIEIPGANHFLVGKENELVKEVSDWLKRNV